MEGAPSHALDFAKLDPAPVTFFSLPARLWRRLPEGVRRRFWLTKHAVRRALLPLRIGWVWRRGSRPVGGEDGLTVVGLLRDTRGVAQAARLFADALEQDGLVVHRLDAGSALQVAATLRAPTPHGVPAHNDTRVLVTCLNPPELVRWLDVTGGRALQGCRHVGYWAWELPEAPPAWRDAFRYVDEVWCHSEFAAGALRKLAPAGVRVTALPLPVFMTPNAAPDRTRFGLPVEACVVLAAIDLRSTSARKNPLGALAAYHAAVPIPDGRSVLACKLSGLESEGEVAQALRAAAARRADILLVTELLSEQDMASLIASADIVLSLHRAEGFGLLPAEAAWLGRAVVATNWSAPMEFLHPEGAALIDWHPVVVEDAQGLYGGIEGATWAEPDIAQAAAALRRLIDDPAERGRVGEQAAAHARVVFESQAWAKRVRSLLAGRADPPANSVAR